MLFTAVAIPQTFLSSPSRRLAAALVLALPCLTWHAGRADAANTVSWHPDLPAAQRASQVTGRPVLAIFTASWMPVASAVERTALSSAEAVAVVTACYEPVCIDVDAQPDITKHVGVSRVPTACVLMADGRVVATFEVPGTPAEFVAAAARAARDAAVAAASQPLVVTADGTPAASAGLPANGSGLQGQDGSDPTAADWTQQPGVVPPGGRAITAVAAKVRMLSDFATNDTLQPPSGDVFEASLGDTSPLPQQASQQPQAASVFTRGGIQSTAAGQPAACGPSMTAQTTLPLGGSQSSTVTSAPTDSLAGTTSRAPLGIEATTTASQPSQATAPWLGMPPASPAGGPAAAPQQTTPAAAVATAPAQVAAIEPRPSAPATVAAPAAVAAPPTNAPAATEAPATVKQPPTSSTSSLLATLQKPFGMFGRTAAPEQRQETAAATATAVAAVENDPYGSMPVGLEGYCPVMLTERGVWVEGRAQWGARHRGRTYLFAGEQQQKAFLQDPDRYAPALSGDDPVLAFDSGKCTPGQRRYGVTYQSRMYLFSSAVTRDAFAANPQRYTAGTAVAENRGTATGTGTVIR